MLKLVSILLKNGLKKSLSPAHLFSSISYSVIDAVDSIYLLDSEEATASLMFKRKVMQRIYTKQTLTLNLL
jgi:hypothetical protein